MESFLTNKNRFLQTNHGNTGFQELLFFHLHTYTIYFKVLAVYV